MNKHIILVSETESKDLILGTAGYLFRFHKRKPEFLDKLTSGNLIFFKGKKGDILGQFEVGKIIIIERVENRDWKIVEAIGEKELGVGEEQFIEKIRENSYLVIIQINKLEQLITSPVEIDKRSKKEWIVLED